jgi:hypothetical protein
LRSDVNSGKLSTVTKGETVTSFRIEITFVGDAPDSELERAKILGSEKVAEAIDNLKHLLADLGLETSVSAKTVREMPKVARGSRKPAPGPSMTSFVAEPTRDAAE